MADDINLSSSPDLRLSVDGEALWGDLSEDELTEVGLVGTVGLGWKSDSQLLQGTAGTPFCRPLDESLQMVLRCW